jgi:hypothetical protein
MLCHLIESVVTCVGPKSAEVVRYVREIPNVLCVLGNHDITLLQVQFDQCIYSFNQPHFVIVLYLLFLFYINYTVSESV